MRLYRAATPSIRPSQPYFALDYRIYKQLKPVDIGGRQSNPLASRLRVEHRKYMIVKGFKANRS